MIKLNLDEIFNAPYEKEKEERLWQIESIKNRLDSIASTIKHPDYMYEHDIKVTLNDISTLLDNLSVSMISKNVLRGIK